MNLVIAKQYLFGTVAEILHRCLVLYEGWECDNEGWIVRLTNGKVCAVSTSHGTPRKWPMEDMVASMELARKSAKEIKEAIRIITS